MPTTFSKVNVSIVGKFDDAVKMPEWIRYHGGTFSRKVDSNTTHLIATEESYKKNVEAVQIAKELGTVYIVKSDWLYDSLQQISSRRPRDAKPYLWERILEAAMNPRKKQKLATTKTQHKTPMKDPFVQEKVVKRKAARNAKKTVALPKDKIYIDEDTNQAWDATLSRILASLRREKFRLAIFQSNETPPTYSAYVKYSRVGKSNISILAPPKSSFTLAKAGFESFFLLQTGIEWDNRMDSTLRPPKMNDEGDVLPPHEGWYTFEAGSIMTAYMKRPSKPRASPEVPQAIPDDGDATRSDEFTLINKEDCTAAGQVSGNDGDVESLQSVSTLSALEYAPGGQIDECDVETIKKNALALLESVPDEQAHYDHVAPRKRKALSILEPASSGETDDDVESAKNSSLSLLEFPSSEPTDDGGVESLKSSTTALFYSTSEQADDADSVDIETFD
ncbi:hypothetical protein N7486_001556 [Penicillium sp. IBT 16267x]|nr:hypothetical protein N7486_001556 [Penicillium sp. IBT 16267x]